jgi:hypothetical protein
VRSELAAALAAFHEELPRVRKDATAQYGKYADLADITPEVLPLLGKHGLAWTCKPKLRKNGMFVLRYKLTHAASGEAERGDWPLGQGGPQQLGSAVTYGRRYCLCAVTGVAPDGDDDDGQSAQPAKQAQAPRTRPAKPREPRDPRGEGEPEGAPGSALPRQLTAIHTGLTRLGITDRERGLKAIENIIDGPLRGPKRGEDGSERTSKNLSYLEAEDVKRELDERLKAAASASAS